MRYGLHFIYEHDLKYFLTIVNYSAERPEKMLYTIKWTIAVDVAFITLTYLDQNKLSLITRTGVLKLKNHLKISKADFKCIRDKK